METVGATRRFFACGYEGGAKRPNVCQTRTEADTQSVGDAQNVGLLIGHSN